MKKNNTIIIAIIATVVVGGISIYTFGRNDSAMEHTMMHDGSIQRSNGQVDKNSMVYKMYSQLSAEDYDRTFLANMIVHHQGAVDMANLALTNARHQEIKDMAHAIISSQTKEIDDMRIWQKQWNYPSTNGDTMTDHSAMGMMDDMAGMTDELKGLQGDAFDREFLSSMIKHHQSAIDMADSGQTGAQHNELKALTKAIVDAQSKEISQMKQWQKDWNY